MNRLNKALPLSILIMMLCSISFAQEKSNYKISGKVFGDYYYVVNDHNSKIQDKNGFWLRRIYLTYDQNISDGFSTRLRFEMSQPGDFETKSTMVPKVKDAYLKYKTGNTEFYLGISPTPTWGVIEKYWGYRFVEKTPLDLQKFGSSRDFGLAVKGKLGKEGVINYHFMFANGSSNKSETNKGKKGMLSVGLYPSKEFVFEVYGDWSKDNGSDDWITVQGFAAYKTKLLSVGVQFAHQTRQINGDKDQKLKIGSIFTTLNLNNNFRLFARVDRMFDPNPQGDKISYIPFTKNTSSTFVVAGLDFSPIKNVHLTPNAEFVFYDADSSGITPGSDLITRLTFSYKF